MACGKSDDAPEPADETAAAPAAACPQENDDGVVEIQEGLTATILSPGYGRRAVSKDYADVHTTLWLYDENAEGGKGTEIGVVVKGVVQVLEVLDSQQTVPAVRQGCGR